jgi:2-polyprenyl-6-methoxyphenol hydroxylase-like FAD-dependent oxidoreductase
MDILPEQTTVLVVGAGPVGLTLAIDLRQRGVDVTVVDAQPEHEHTSRAAVVHARTLEVLEPLGVAKPLVERGLPIERFAVRDRDRLVLAVPFGGLPTAYPYTLMVSQAVTEQVLGDRLIELGGRVLRPVTVTALEQTPAQVTVVTADGRRTLASYVVGADGMGSTVRTQAGIGFSGAAYAESFTLADVRLAGEAVPPGEVILYFSPAGMMVCAPLPGGIHRLVATVAEAPHQPDREFLQRLFDTRGPEASRAEVAGVVWGSRFRVHHRVADRYRSGRVLLAGDAAHVHSPAGGQGMNTGITDAAALAPALTAALAAGTTEALDGYGATRRPVALRVVALADRLTRLATVPPAARPVRNLALRTATRVPGVSHRLAMQLSGLVYR